MMTRYEAIEILEDEMYMIWETASEKAFAMKRNEAFDMAIKALSVDLVRCGDCIYSRPAYPILCSKPRGLTSVESEDCFCSYGERRSDE